MSSVSYQITLFLVFDTALVECSQKEHVETKLLTRLFDSSYDSKARPPFGGAETVTVDFRFDLKQIYQVSEREQTVSILTSTYQEWRDPRLRWNESDYDGLTSFSVFYTSLWTPDTTLYNTVDMYRQNVEDRGNARVSSDGNSSGGLVNLMYNTHHTIGCRFNMKYFPFDVQNCTFIFGSWTYDQSQLDYTLSVDYVTTESFRENDEWSLVSFNMTAVSLPYECCKYPYKVMYAHLVIRRKYLYYVFNLVLPTVIINIMASFGLFASPGNASNRHDKLQIGITTLLSYCILLLTVSDQIPRGSTAIPLISWFFFSVMVQNAIKMYVAIFLSYPDRRRYVRRVCKQLGRSLMKHAVRLLRMKTTTLQKTTTVQSTEENKEETLEDRWPELICLWISMTVLAAITIAMFAVALSRRHLVPAVSCNYKNTPNHPYCPVSGV